MNKVTFSDDFLKNGKKLPSFVRFKLSKLLNYLEEDAFHPLLHSKPLSGSLTWKYSFRITRDWRVIFIFEEENVINLIDVGHRKDIYR